MTIHDLCSMSQSLHAEEYVGHLPHTSARKTLKIITLSESTILELRTILIEEYGCDCSVADSSEIASYLVQYVETLQEIDKDK